jgi:hypothetical protein
MSNCNIITLLMQRKIKAIKIMCSLKKTSFKPRLIVPQEYKFRAVESVTNRVRKLQTLLTPVSIVGKIVFDIRGEI